MNKFKNKKLLHLGYNLPTCDIVKYAKKEGAYVINANKMVLDKPYYAEYVDEFISLDIDNIDDVIKYCKENKVDAVSSTWSEKEIEKTRIINEAIGNKYLHTKDQWTSFMNKARFRELCDKYDIATPKTYFMGHCRKSYKEIFKSVKFPCVIKPVSMSGGIGISFCKNKIELYFAIKKAVKYSNSDEIIIEEYLQGDEIGATYVIQNGIVKLVALGDKYDHYSKRLLTVLPLAYLFPSKYYNEYIFDFDPKITKLLKDNGLDNCTIFFQGKTNKNGIYFFEAGLRFEGLLTYETTKHFSKQNYFEFIIDCLLKAKTDYDITKEDAFFYGRKSIIYGMMSKGGKINKIEGMDEIFKEDLVYFTIVMRKIGDKTNKKDIMSYIIGGIRLDFKELDEALPVLDKIKKIVKVLDKRNKNLLLDDFDFEKLR